MACVSVGSYHLPNEEPAIEVPKIVEYLQFLPSQRRLDTWVDIFIKNQSELAPLRVLRRGKVKIEDVTYEWKNEENLLTRILKEIHEPFDHIEVDTLNERITANDRFLYFGLSKKRGNETYKFLTGAEILPIISKTEQPDAPFSLYEIRNIPPGNSVIRIKSVIEGETYDYLIGDEKLFYIYGGDVLVKKARYSDLPLANENNYEKYAKIIDDFETNYMITPVVYEIILFADEPPKLPKAVPLTPDISTYYIPNEILSSKVHCFICYSSKFVMKGYLKNDFIIGIERQDIEGFSIEKAN